MLEVDRPPATVRRWRGLAAQSVGSSRMENPQPVIDTAFRSGDHLPGEEKKNIASGCPAPVRERAWSSPIFVDYAVGEE
jgi:hypothetical protein